MYHQPPPNVDSSTSIEGMPGALPSKTPVSLLQELCMRRGISPKYDLLQIEGAVHEPTFVYRVTVGEFAANGSGQSKKKAKHAAAKAVLDIIIQGGAAGAGGPTAGGSPGAPPELSTQIVSPYDDGIPGNPVGSLQELCMARRWPPPTYDLTSEEGFPHERTFSIACTIGNTKEIGTGKSKKLAKRQAAYKMTQRLKDQPVEQTQVNVLADDDDEVKGEITSALAGLHDAYLHKNKNLPSFSNNCGTFTYEITFPNNLYKESVSIDSSISKSSRVAGAHGTLSTESDLEYHILDSDSDNCTLENAEDEMVEDLTEEDVEEKVSIRYVENTKINRRVLSDGDNSCVEDIEVEDIIEDATVLDKHLGSKYSSLALHATLHGLGLKIKF